MAKYVALLRGINVGGKNKLPMKDLAAMFVEAGCANVRTFIQSGNVIFDADPDVAAKLPERITAQITKGFSYKIPIMLRTTAQLEEAIRNNPFLARGEDEDTLHIMFLADVPNAERVAALDANRSPGDEFIVRGHDVYLHLPNGAAKTKLSNAYFDSKLSTVSTGRNWRTANTLLDLMKS